MTELGFDLLFESVVAKNPRLVAGIANILNGQFGDSVLKQIKITRSALTPSAF
ncbi:MAG: hypothetical protein Q8L60_13420 [Gammaproteobacteria bacterium]|nr:hypothetical protein [Gammaproteobacteria bacterium]MDP2347678.1 hypothetical protein [Gammaproteobacteria bacterium]